MTYSNFTATLLVLISCGFSDPALKQSEQNLLEQQAVAQRSMRDCQRYAPLLTEGRQLVIATMGQS